MTRLWEQSDRKSRMHRELTGIMAHLEGVGYQHDENDDFREGMHYIESAYDYLGIALDLTEYRFVDEGLLNDITEDLVEVNKILSEVKETHDIELTEKACQIARNAVQKSYKLPTASHNLKWDSVVYEELNNQDRLIRWSEKVKNLDFVNEKRMESWDKKLDYLYNKYYTKLSIEVPVEYWEKRADTHFRLALIAGLTFSAIVVIALHFLISNRIEIITLINSPIGNGVSYGAVAIAGVIGFLVLWILRVISRLFLVNILSNNDARYRATMTKTFLALMEKKPEHIQESDKLVVLEALCRPSIVDVNTDDGAPPHWVDLVAKRLAPK